MRAALRRAAILMTASAGASVLAAGMMVAGAGPAAATSAILYAAPAPAGAGDCSAPANACDLATALTDVAAGGMIELVTAGSTADYVGNWSVNTGGTSASAPVTIEPAPGVSNPVLDGNNGASAGCSTASRNGPVLTVPSGEFVALSGITVADGDNTSTGYGGGLANAGTVTITGCIFTGNTASGVITGVGGAIDSGGGGGLGGTGSVTVTASSFTGNTAGFVGGAIGSGDYGGGGGTVTVTASTFSGNTAYGGGAIDSGSVAGGGSVTVTASTFSGNTATLGGAIDSGEHHGGGSVTVTASTFSGNTATSDGGAIDSGDFGGGTVTVTASTFSGNTASFGGNTIDGGDGGGGGTVQVAGDVFDGSCDQAAGTWADGGYNAGSDGSCFNSGAGNVNAGSSAALMLGPLASNGGPTQTIAPVAGSPVTGIIPDPTTVTLGSQVQLCPATDQRGYASANGTACDAGAVQTSGGAPALALADTAAPATFNAAGQVITYSYTVSNTGAGLLTGIGVTDPAVPGVSCPSATLAPGTSQVCTGSYTTTAGDLAAGTITDTATATAASGGVAVTSNPATVTVTKGWPPVVTGTYRPAAGAAEGYYLGVTTNTWQLLVTHPGTGKVAFTGRISVPAGTLGHLTLINPTAGHQVSTTGKLIIFTLPNYGKVTGFRFTTSAKVTSITLTLNVAGHPATATQIYLSSTPTQASSGSPLTFTR